MSFSLRVEEVTAFTNCKATDVFSHFQHLPWAMLLDTCDNKLSDGRFDIIVHSPIAKVTQKQAGLGLWINDEWQEKLNPNGSDTVASQDLYTLLAEVHALFCGHITLEQMQQSKSSPLPFLCGALGYFNYDLNIEQYPSHLEDVKPSQYATADLGVGIYDQSLIFDNRTGKVYCCFINEERATLLNHEKFASSKISTATPFKLKREWQANLSEREYTERLEKIDDYIHAGDCYQINFAQRFEAPYEGCEWQAYEQLRKVNKAPFSAFIRLEKSAILSVSPERFLQAKEGIVETKPIKGTRKRAQNKQDDALLSRELLSSEKDKAENLMIVDLLRNDLSKYCQPGSVSVPELFALESYPAVHHMVSTVLGKLKTGVSPLLLLKGAFPGGSITGAPKLRAMQIIQELEPDKRSIYCGSIGYIGIRNDMDTNICIRTVLAENNRLYCWAGGGIVLDSNIKEEYQESLDKVAKILPVLEATLESNKQ